MEWAEGMGVVVGPQPSHNNQWAGAAQWWWESPPLCLSKQRLPRKERCPWAGAGVLCGCYMDPKPCTEGPQSLCVA